MCQDVLIVLNHGEGVCADPGKRDAILGIGGPGPQRRVKSSSWFQTVEEGRHSNMARNTGDGPATTSGDSHAQSECCRAL